MAEPAARRSFGLSPWDTEAAAQTRGSRRIFVAVLGFLWGRLGKLSYPLELGTNILLVVWQAFNFVNPIHKKGTKQYSKRQNK